MSSSFRANDLQLRHIAVVACALTSMCLSPTAAHERWADGSPIPAWVEQSCCSVADAHRLKVSQIYRAEGGWRAEGHDYLIPEHEVLPSQDEHVWLFSSILGDGSQSHAICFFLPQGSI